MAMQFRKFALCCQEPTLLQIFTFAVEILGASEPSSRIFLSYAG